MVIAILQGISPEAIAAKGTIKSLLGLLGQEGEIELPPKGLCFLLDVVKLLVEPLPHFFGDHMKRIPHSSPKGKGPLSMA
jgi:hypothetical protein